MTDDQSRIRLAMEVEQRMNEAIQNQEIKNDENLEIEEEDESFDPDWLKKQNAEDREYLAAAHLEEEEELRRAMGKDGEYRSLFHKMRYMEQGIPPQLPGGPDPRNYPSEAEEQYERDVEAFQATGRLANGLNPAPDDPHKSTREALTRDIADHRRKAALAEARHDRKGKELHDYHANAVERELEGIPEPPSHAMARENLAKFREQSLEMAFDENAAEPWWNTQRMQGDAAIEAAKHLAESDSTTIYLPLEKSPGAFQMRDFHPKNVAKFDDLPAEVLEDIRKSIHFSQDKSPDKVFKIAWDVISGGGYASRAKRSAAHKPAKAKKSKPKDGGYRKGMTQAEYEAWRESQGASRF